MKTTHKETGNILVSIITIVYNSENTLEKTIKSVINQSYENIEYIIIDGGSTDRSLEIIKKYQTKICYWISEKDNGISDAFNKGIMKANGEIIGIINSDDWYEKDAVESIVKEYNLKNEIICAKIKLWNTENHFNIKTSTLVGIEKQMKIWHPGMFVPKKVYSEIGLFNVNIKIMMDYDFILRCIQQKIKFKFIEACISNMKYGGVSNQLITKSMKETLWIKNKYFGKKLKHLFEYYFLNLYFHSIICLKKIIYV